MCGCKAYSESWASARHLNSAGEAESFWEHKSSVFVFHLHFTNVQNEDSSLLTSDLPGNLRWPNLRQYASEEKHIQGGGLWNLLQEPVRACAQALKTFPSVDYYTLRLC